MQTRKAYAVSLGLANEGRGRMSREALAAIDKAIASGMTFSDMDKHKSNASFGRNTGANPAGVKPKSQRQIPLKSAPSGSDVMIESPRTYEDSTYWTYQNAKGKTVKVDGKQVCGTCMVSLFWHKCSTPNATTADGRQNLTVHLG